MKRNTVYNVVISDRAEADYDGFLGWLILDQRSPSMAKKWLNGFLKAIERLERLPKAYPSIAEAESLGRDVRSLRYKSHRIIFNVNEPSRTVTILRIYHSSRQPLRTDDLEP